MLDETTFHLGVLSNDIEFTTLPHNVRHFLMKEVLEASRPVDRPCVASVLVCEVRFHGSEARNRGHLIKVHPEAHTTR